jgi:hypothetical protein
MIRRCKSGSIPGFGEQRAHAIAEGIIGAVIMEPWVKSHCPMRSKNPSLHLVVDAGDDVRALGLVGRGQPPLSKHGHSLWDRIQSKYDVSDSASLRWG